MKRTLFIHVPRTAGTSMLRHIGRYVPKFQDLSFPLRPTCDPTYDLTLTDHISVGSLIERNVFTKEWYNGCFKFAFVRNPWDRLVSLWEHLRGYRPFQKRERASNAHLATFGEFLEAVVEKDFVRPLSKRNCDDWSQANPQTEWLKWGVDFIGRFENLDADWRRLCGEAGMPYRRLERHRATKERCHYGCYYRGRRMVRIVADKYAEEIERFGYSFW